jgi:hypothetical protein
MTLPKQQGEATVIIDATAGKSNTPTRAWPISAFFRFLFILSLLFFYSFILFLVLCSFFPFPFFSNS